VSGPEPGWTGGAGSLPSGSGTSTSAAAPVRTAVAAPPMRIVRIPFGAPGSGACCVLRMIRVRAVPPPCSGSSPSTRTSRPASDRAFCTGLAASPTGSAPLPALTPSAVISTAVSATLAPVISKRRVTVGSAPPGCETVSTLEMTRPMVSVPSPATRPSVTDEATARTAPSARVSVTASVRTTGPLSTDSRPVAPERPASAVAVRP
jgi:hypothetical protein